MIDLVSNPEGSEALENDFLGISHIKTMKSRLIELYVVLHMSF